MELIGLNITPSVKQVQHHLENATISIRKARLFFFCRPGSRAGGSRQVFGDKSSSVVPQICHRSSFHILCPWACADNTNKGCEKIMGCNKYFACRILLESGYHFIWTEMDFWIYGIINIMRVISLIFKITLPKLLEKNPNQTKRNQTKPKNNQLKIFSGIFSNFASSRAVESVLSENLMTTFSSFNDNIFNNEDFQLQAEDTECWGSLACLSHCGLHEL